MRRLTTAALLLAALLLGCFLTLPSLDPASAATHATHATLSRSAHIAYGGCPARDVVLTVAVPGHPFVPGQLVTYRVSLHNLSGRTCAAGTRDTTAAGTSPLANGSMLGPCSPLPVRIANSHGLVVYPPFVAVLCPALLGPALSAHGTINTVGSWDQMEGGGRPAHRVTLAPRGTYHLNVAGKVSVPIVLVGPSTSVAP